VDFELTDKNIDLELPKHSFYRGSDFLLLRNGEQWAVLAIEKHSDRPGEKIFHNLTGLRVLSLPETTCLVSDPGVDVLNPTALATRAGKEVEANPGLTTVIIEGEFTHLSFIHKPALLPVEVHDITPPHPPKLLHQAQKVLGYHDVGTPVELLPRLGDLGDMAADAGTGEVILPCFGGRERRITREATVKEPEDGRQNVPEKTRSNIPVKIIHYLDGLPADLAGRDATLIGCERSMEIYEGHYGGTPAHFYNICPADDEYLKKAEGLEAVEGTFCLAKCCQLKKGHKACGNVAYVGWGATLADVEGALRYLVDRAREAGVAPINAVPGLS